MKKSREEEGGVEPRQPATVRSGCWAHEESRSGDLKIGFQLMKVEGKRERKMKRLLVMKKQNGRPFNSTTCFAFSAAYGLAVEVTELVRLHPHLQRLHRGFQIWASFHRPATGVSGVFSKQDNHHWTSLLENFQVL